MTATDTSMTVVREITIKAPAARVFAALTEPDQLTQWWGDEKTYRVTQLKRDLRVGGTWQSTGTSTDGREFIVQGVYRAIDPPRLLEYTWRPSWAPDPTQPDTVVRIDLFERDGGTLVRVTHSGFADAAQRNSHDDGWMRVFGWLRAFVEK
jgi:glutathione S-transferase